MSADRESQFRLGLQVVQLGLISDSALLLAVEAWLSDSQRTLQEVLCSQEAVPVSSRQAIADYFAKTKPYTNDDVTTPHAFVSDKEVEKVKDFLAGITLRDLADDDLEESSDEELYGDRTAPYEYTSQSQSSSAFIRNEVDRFRLGAKHAQGGLGVIFKAKDLQLHRTVAVKKIRSRQAGLTLAREKFFLEAEVTGNLEHPGIVPVYAFGFDRSKQPFYAMRFIHGENLHVHIKKLHEKVTSAGTRFDGIELRKLLRQFLDVCNAVEYAHARGILHRDLKPANIMLGDHGETLVVDWGLAKVIKKTVESQAEPVKDEVTQPIVLQLSGSTDQTQFGSFLGTRAYASPEQLIGEVDMLCQRSDVYSLGAILYEILCGKTALGGVASELEAHKKIKNGLISAPRTVKKGVPKPLEVICRKAMSFDKLNRYASARDLATDIERWMADERVLAYQGKEPMIEFAGRFVRRNRSWVLAIFTSLFVISAISLAASYLVNRSRENEALAKKLALDRQRSASTAIDSFLVGTESLSEFPMVMDLQQRTLELAANDYSKLVEVTRNDPELEIERIRAMVRLADFQHMQGKIAEAYETYDAAISSFGGDGLASGVARKPSISNLDFAMQIEIGRVFSRRGLALDRDIRIDEARLEFNRAIELFRNLKQQNSSSTWVQGNLAVALANVGGLEERSLQAAKAITCLEESLPLFQSAIQAGENRFRVASCEASERLGRVLRESGRLKESNDVFNAAIDWVSRLIAADPNYSDLRERKASLFVSRAKLEQNFGDLKKANEALEFGAAEYAELQKAWPNNLAYQEAAVLVEVDKGLVQLYLGNILDAKERLTNSSMNLDEIRINYPIVERFQEEFATSLSGLAQALTELNQDDVEARRAYQESISICEDFSRKSQVEGNQNEVLHYLQLTATFKSQYAMFLHSRNEIDSARIEFNKAIEYLSAVVSQSGDYQDTNYRLANAIWQSGLLEYDDQKVDVANEKFAAAIEMLKSIDSDKSSPVVKHQLALCYLRCPVDTFRNGPLALKYAMASYDAVPTNRAFANALAGALIRNNDIETSAKMIEQIKNAHNQLNSWDEIVQVQIHRAKGEAELADQALARATAWAQVNRPANMEIQRLIRELESAMQPGVTK